MKRYDIRVRYSFEGTYTVAAEDRDEAKKMVNDDCGLVLGGDIHTTRDDDEVLEWDFCIHPDTRILSLQEEAEKELPSEPLISAAGSRNCGGTSVDAIRQLLHAHCMKEIRLPEEDYDPVWVIWFGVIKLSSVYHRAIFSCNTVIFLSVYPCWRNKSYPLGRY